MTSRVLVALRVKASPERCFDAFTQDIGVWWKPSGLFQTTPRAPGVLSFENRDRLIETLESGKVFEIGRVKVWERPSKLVFSWRQASFPPDLHTEVEVTFTAVDGETRIAVTHAGFDRVPDDSAARHTMPDPVLLKHLAGYWRDQLQSLDGRL